MSSDDNDGEAKKHAKPQSKRGGHGSRGGVTRKPAAKKTQEHIVSIPTNLLNSKPLSAKKRKGQEVSKVVLYRRIIM